jgi:hypothetical protein
MLTKYFVYLGINVLKQHQIDLKNSVYFAVYFLNLMT